VATLENWVFDWGICRLVADSWCLGGAVPVDLGRLRSCGFTVMIGCQRGDGFFAGHWHALHTVRAMPHGVFRYRGYRLQG